MKKKQTPERMTAEQLDAEILRLVPEIAHLERVRNHIRLNDHGQEALNNIRLRRLDQDIQSKRKELFAVQKQRRAIDEADDQQRLETNKWDGVSDHEWRTGQQDYE